MKRSLLGTLLGLSSLAAQCAGLAAQPWPPEQPCPGCATLQFGGLEMQFSPSLVGRFFVPTDGQPFVALAPPEQGLPQGPVIQAMEAKALRQRYQRLGIFEKHRLRTPLAFYELLGDTSRQDESLDLVRKAESIADAVSYEKFSKGPLTAIRIRQSDPRLDIAYLFTDRPDIYYMVAGDMPKNLWERLLSTLKSVAVP
ncbi:hypothetical protein [Paracidovorax anthurii]|nr:hypothetical protein [Paracidovorax anthurii]